jgi:hypothetical protein
MDIHKPKPWHGVREFLKEYAIIVVGVLTALAAEQVVEWLHTQTEVREARAALHAEMSRDLRTLVLQARENGCWQGGLAAIQAWAEGSGPKPVWPGGLMQGLGVSVWDVAKTGAVPHMELNERLAMATFYGGIENQKAIIHDQREHSKQLVGYLNRASLDPQEAHALIRAIGETRANLSGETRNVAGMVDQGRKLGVEPGSPHPDFEARVDRLCAAFPAQPVRGTP